MAQTETTLINRVLNKLGAVGSGQSVSAEDSAIVQAQIAPTLQRLASERIVYIADSNDFEDAFLEPLAEIMAQVLASDFGGQPQPAMTLMAEMSLRRIQSQPASYETLSARFY